MLPLPASRRGRFTVVDGDGLGQAPAAASYRKLAALDEQFQQAPF
jgi:hypothetical protein